MTLIIIATLSLLLLSASLWSVVRHDPPREAPRSHPVDAASTPPVRWCH